MAGQGPDTRDKGGARAAHGRDAGRTREGQGRDKGDMQLEVWTPRPYIQFGVFRAFFWLMFAVLCLATWDSRVKNLGWA